MYDRGVRDLGEAAAIQEHGSLQQHSRQSDFQPLASTPGDALRSGGLHYGEGSENAKTPQTYEDKAAARRSNKTDRPFQSSAEKVFRAQMEFRLLAFGARHFSSLLRPSLFLHQAFLYQQYQDEQSGL